MAGPSMHHNSGRSVPYNFSNSSTASPGGSTNQISHSTSLATRLNPHNDERAGVFSPSSATPRLYQSNPNNASRSQLRNVVTNMATPPQTSAPRSASGHGKLHKRGSSGGSSLPAPPSPHSQFTTPFATYEEPFPDASATPALGSMVGSTVKIKPYIRKISASKQEDGILDLSKSISENDRLAGLGIQDFATRSVSNVSFPHAAGRGAHARATSIGSQASTGSGSYKPNQPFVHPMRQTPRPYTPPAGSGNATFVHHDEASESDDVIDDDFTLGNFRSKRSLSITSMPAAAPTPLSQSHTAEDLGIVPKLTSPSQTNLSIRSGQSRPGRSRRETDRSIDLPTSPSSRTSFDRAFSFVSRKSDPDIQTRDERIRAARRKFDEKEANKDRKLQQEKMRRRETEESKYEKHQERKTEAPEQLKLKKSRRHDDSAQKKERQDEGPHGERLASRSYDEYSPAHQMSLPRQGREAGMAKKGARSPERAAPSPKTGFVRFSAWWQTRLLSCGGRRHDGLRDERIHM